MCLLVVLLKASSEDANFNLFSKRFLIIYQPHQPKTTKLVINKIIANLLDFFFFAYPDAIYRWGAADNQFVFGCVHHAANLRLRRLAEPIPLQARPPVCHIKAEASRLVPCPRTQQANLPACSPQPPLNAECQAEKL